MPWWASLLIELVKLLPSILSHINGSPDGKKQAVSNLPGTIKSALKKQVAVGGVPDTV